MKNFRSPQLAAIVIAMLVGAALLVFKNQHSKLVYSGKSLAFWLKKFDDPKATKAQQEASEAVSNIGTNAIPTLLGMLQAGDSSLRVRIYNLAYAYHLPFHFSRLPNYKLEAQRAFEILGARASNAVPDLIRIYDPNNVGSVEPVLNSISYIGPAADSAVPFLLQLVATNSNPRAKMCALGALIDIHPSPELMVPILTKCLHDYDPYWLVRDTAVYGLGEYGTNSRVATSDLLVLYSDTMVIGSLAKMYEIPRSKHYELALVVTDLPDPNVLPQLLGDFGAMGSNAAPAVSALIKFLSDTNENVRFSATNALKAIDPIVAAKNGIK